MLQEEEGIHAIMDMRKLMRLVNSWSIRLASEHLGAPEVRSPAARESKRAKGKEFFLQ